MILNFLALVLKFDMEEVKIEEPKAPVKIKRSKNNQKKLLEITFIIAIVAAVVSAVIKTRASDYFISKTGIRYIVAPEPNPMENIMRPLYIISSFMLVLSICIIIICAFFIEKRKVLRQKTSNFPWIVLSAMLVCAVQLFFVLDVYGWDNYYNSTKFIKSVDSIAQIFLCFYYSLVIFFTIWILRLKLSKKPRPINNS